MKKEGKKKQDHHTTVQQAGVIPRPRWRTRKMTMVLYRPKTCSKGKQESWGTCLKARPCGGKGNQQGDHQCGAARSEEMPEETSECGGRVAH
ncbi:hypothetical protein E2C01_067531 [Portunus trituberculatus]|uniref:Uncharacterized protein n=1 Tax=Portunus trituberculatus TaxID=210409 RepID=A0A5B7HTW2_PORTR|nr:hypothetical protein [Portunus trituberculatus]